MKAKKPVFIILFSLLAIVAVLSGTFLAGIFSAFPGFSSASVDKINTPIVNILVMGTDESGLRSDTMMLVSFHTKDKKCNILSIPRDTRVTINNAPQKINAALAIGKEDLSIKKVKELTGLPIHYYFTVNFKAVENIVDILGGVEFDVPERMYYNDPTQNLLIDLQPGLQRLNGKDAVCLLRYRGYATADLGRISVQQDFVRALVDQKLNLKYITKVNDIFNEVKKNINTNMSTGDIAKYVMAAKDMTGEDIQMYQLPGEPKYIGNVSYVICNEAETKELMDSVFNEPEPSEAVD